MGGFFANGSWCLEKGDAPVSQKKEFSVKFVGFVPNQIELADNYGPRLVGLPFNILFAGILKNKRTREQSLVNACYWPAPDTFREKSTRKEMCYFTKPPNDFFVRVVFEKKPASGKQKNLRAKISSRLRKVLHSMVRCFIERWAAWSRTSALA